MTGVLFALLAIAALVCVVLLSRPVNGGYQPRPDGRPRPKPPTCGSSVRGPQ